MHEEGAAPASVWLTLREHALALRGMGRRLRLVTALAVAQVIAAAVFLALRGINVSTTPVVGGAEGLVSVPNLILWITVAFIVVAWGYLLAAASHAHPVIAVLGLGAFAAALVPLEQDVGWHGAAGAVRVAVLVALALTVIAGLLRNRRQTESTWLDSMRVVLVTLLVGAVYGTFAWDAAASTVARQFTFAIADQLMTMSFFLLPVLYLTGAEFAEWAELAGSRVAGLLQRAGSTPLLVLGTAAISLAVLIHDGISFGRQLPSQIVLFGLAGAVLVWLGRRTRPAAGWGHALPWAVLALIACAFIGVLLTEVYRSTSLAPERHSAADSTIGGPLRQYVYASPPKFQLRIPENWEVLSLERGGSAGPTLIGFSGRSTGNPADFFVTAAPGHLLAPGAALLPQFLDHFYADLHPQVGSSQTVHGWRETPFGLGPRLAGVAWERRIASSDWLLVGYANRRLLALNRPLFGVMWQSFSAHAPPAAAPAEARHAPSRSDPYAYSSVLTVPFVVWLLVTLSASAGLLVLRRRLRPPVALSLLVVSVFGLLFVLSEARQVLEEILDAPAGLFYSLRLPGIQCAVGLAALVWLGVLAFRRRLSDHHPQIAALFMLVGGLQLLRWIAELYQTASGVGARLSIAQGVVILLALLWELTVSGESITNRHSRLLPRASRILAFCGYIMLVATAVMFFSSLRMQASGAAIEPQFESEGWPALGILQLGVPALLCLAALHLGLMRPRLRSEASKSHDPKELE